MSINDITGAIINAAINVHQELGPGLLESAYRTCVAYELDKAGLRVQQEKPIPVVYKEAKLECGFRADLFVEKEVKLLLNARPSKLCIRLTKHRSCRICVCWTCKLDC